MYACIDKFRKPAKLEAETETTNTTNALQNMSSIHLRHENMSFINLRESTRVPVCEFWVSDSGFRVSGLGFRVPSFGFRIPVSGFRLSFSHTKFF